MTHVGSFRYESSFRTWVWKIATRHLLRMLKTRHECSTDFNVLEAMIDRGDALPNAASDDLDMQRLAAEVRLGCTHAMIVALAREHRIAYILSDIFLLSSEHAASILAIDSVTFRKRVQRARARLGAFMQRKCGLVNAAAACRCIRQIPVLEEIGMLTRSRLVYAELAAHARPSPSLPEAWNELSELDAVARAMQSQPEYRTPELVFGRIRELLDSGKFQILQ
jgi:DNA-directed RNA polymerase specialized sigma24 family protein